MGSRILVAAKRRRFAAGFVGIFLDLGALAALAVKLTGLLGLWLQTAGCTCMYDPEQYVGLLLLFYPPIAFLGS